LTELLQPFGIILIVATFVSVVVGLFHYLYFVRLPQWAIIKHSHSDPERLRRYLERVLATPSLLGPGMKIVARTGLVGIYLLSGKHAEAAAHCRAILAALASSRHRDRHGALEADTRRRLADCLEALGQHEEAEEERRRAEEELRLAPSDSLRHSTKGLFLERQHHYEEAYREYQKALELTPLSNVPVRIDCIMRLVLASHKAGRPTDSLRWAEEAITLGASDWFFVSAHRMAAIACGNLGRLDESEEHYRKAYDAAASAKKTPEIAEILGSLASCLCKRGKLIEANETCIKAAAMDPKGKRMSLAVQSQVLRAWGRYDESLAILAAYKDAGKVVIPDLERRLIAVCVLDTARIEAECGRADAAWQHIQEALAVLRNDAKLGLKCDAVCCWVLAARGLADESERVSSEVETRLSDFEDDPSTRRGVLHDLGMAACVRGDHHAGIDCWTCYLGLSPDPVHQPTALYQRGECYRQLNQLTEARNDYRAAVAMNLDTHHARLAQQQLNRFAPL
jgi:tetratricopeptide (TPR) repeat protein